MQQLKIIERRPPMAYLHELARKCGEDRSHNEPKSIHGRTLKGKAYASVS